MIWSMLKVLLFFAAVAGVTWGAAWLLHAGDGIRIAVAGYEFTLGPLQAVICLIVLIAVLWLLLRLVGLILAVIRFVSGDETALSRYFDRNRAKKGYTALADGMVALASGENRVAMSRALKAEKLLGTPELTNILVAQAAEAAGDTTRAETAYRALLGNQRTRFVGIRGLLAQKISEGDRETALKLAEKAFELKPKHPELQDVLLKLQAGQADWKGARHTLDAKRRSGGLTKDVYRRRDAVLALQEARKVMEEGASIEAREAAISANRMSPDLVPAAAMAARSLAAVGDRKSAMRVLKKAWDAQPHPDLAAAFADIDPEETPAQRLKRFKMLTDIHPDSVESRMLLAELQIADEDFPAARRTLGDLPETQPTGQLLALRAAIARGEGADEAEVRAWLARALTAPRGPQWVCDKCHSIHATWEPICENCGGFDTLSWQIPPKSATAAPTGAEMLPLLVNPPPPPEPEIEPAPEAVPEKEEEPIDLVAIARKAN